MNVAVGDVLLGKTTTTFSPYGRIWINERWLPIMLDADATFLVISVTDID